MRSSTWTSEVRYSEGARVVSRVSSWMVSVSSTFRIISSVGNSSISCYYSYGFGSVLSSAVTTMSISTSTS